MHPETPFCHNPQCPAGGHMGQGNIRVHSQAQQRYRCTPCDQTFAATKDTPFYRLRTAADVVMFVLTWLSHGGPTQAIVAAFGVDERTLAAWLTCAGQHGQRVHQQVVKRDVQRRVGCVERRAVQGTEPAIGAVLTATHSGTGLNTAYLEQLKDTVRASLAPLVRRGLASPHRGDRDARDVAGRLCRHLLLAACELRVAAPRRAP